MLGEDKVFYGSPNRYTAKVTSMRVKILAFKCSDFTRDFKRIMGDLSSHFKIRNQIVEEQLKRLRKNNRNTKLTNFEHHVIQSLPKYKEINWNEVPLEADSDPLSINKY